MPKSIGILDDGEDKNRERDEVKVKFLVCVARHPFAGCVIFL